MKKRLLLVLILSTYALFSFAQGLINNGASIYMSGGATMYISGVAGNYTNQNAGQITAGASDSIILGGNWSNNGSNAVFADNGGIVSLIGNNQVLGGTNSTSFNTVLVKGTGTTSLGHDILVGGGYASPTGILDINSHPLDLNGRTLTISNPIAGTSANGAIHYTSGYIISEKDSLVNKSIITWQMGGAGNIGNHIFPFGTAGGVQIPVTFAPTSATNTNVSISTRRNIDNSCGGNVAGSCNQPWTQGVTNMNDIAGIDISVSSIIDRWWQIDVTTPITASLNLSYQGIENTTTNPTNTFTAQEWNSVGSTWYGPLGLGAGVTTGVGSVFVPLINGFGPMVLVESGDPLPVTLVSFQASCLSKGTTLSWTTASESNVNYYTVERSFNGDDFTALGSIKATGNNASSTDYSYFDNTGYSTIAYYRLAQVNMDGSTNYSPIINADCHFVDPFAIAIYPNPNPGNYLNVHLTGLNANANVEMHVVDILGRQVMSEINSVADGSGTLITGLDLQNGLPKGVYNIVIQAEGAFMSKSFVIQ